MGIIQTVKASRPFQKFTRVFQFLSSIISLGLFASRLAKLGTTGFRISRSSNASVIAILASAVLYTLVSMVIRFLLKKKIAPNWMRWVWIIFDILFIIAFIVVAVLTRPNGGKSGPDCSSRRIEEYLPSQANCNLPWGTFILAIISTLLHFITALFNEVRDHHNNNFRDHELEKAEQRNHM